MQRVFPQVPELAAILAVAIMLSNGSILEAGLKSRTEIEEERVQRTYAQSRARGIKSINDTYLAKFTGEKKQFFQDKNLDGIKKIDEVISILEAENAYIDKTAMLRTGRIPVSVEVEALIDGSDEFHISKSGVYWVSYGAAKAGRHQGRDEPTFLNDEEWKPQWEENRKDRGRDASATKRMDMIPEILRFELIAIGNHRGATEIEQRSPVTGHYDSEDERYVITLPDSEGSSRWYRFRFYYPDLIDVSLESPIKSDLGVVDKYIETRGAGLSRLNQMQITALEKIKGSYLQEEDLIRAERLEKRIEKLRRENGILSGN